MKRSLALAIVNDLFHSNRILLIFAQPHFVSRHRSAIAIDLPHIILADTTDLFNEKYRRYHLKSKNI
jgi:hypothetical protein